MSQPCMKVVILGAAGVGKTCIMSRFCYNTFEDTRPTIAGSFRVRILKSPDGKFALKYQVWDTAGDEKYRSVIKIYYKDAEGALIVYDITNKRSFDDLEYWIEQVRANSLPQCHIVIVGNKSENPEASAVDITLAKALANKHEASFFLTSAKMNINIQECFLEIGKKKFPDLLARLTSKGPAADPYLHPNPDIDVDSESNKPAAPRQGGSQLFSIRKEKKPGCSKC